MQVDWPRRLVLLAIAAAVLVAAAPAAAKTYEVSGKQIVVNEDKGIYKMRGSLIGRWTITSFDGVRPGPLLPRLGNRVLQGLSRPPSATGAASTTRRCTLSMTFEYWALFGSEDPESLVWGCVLAPRRERDRRLRRRQRRLHDGGHPDLEGRQDQVHRQPDAPLPLHARA